MGNVITAECPLVIQLIQRKKTFVPKNIWLYNFADSKGKKNEKEMA